MSASNDGILLHRCHQVDVFEVEAVSLGELSQCIVGHDGDGIGEGWYLDEIVVREGPDATHEYVFTCCRFVAVSDSCHVTKWTECIKDTLWPLVCQSLGLHALGGT